MSNRIPVILTGQALRSLRDSGYSLSAAIAEVVDNSLEAQANRIRVRLDESQANKGKRHIHRIAVSDDGIGMGLDVLHHYPQIGYSTRYMSNTTIGQVWRRGEACGAQLQRAARRLESHCYGPTMVSCVFRPSGR